METGKLSHAHFIKVTATAKILNKRLETVVKNGIIFYKSDGSGKNIKWRLIWK